MSNVDDRHLNRPSAREDLEHAQEVPPTPQTSAASYRLAFADRDFMLRDELRQSDPEAVNAFLDEVRAKASVVHQHVAPVYEAHQEGEAIFYGIGFLCEQTGGSISVFQ